MLSRRGSVHSAAISWKAGAAAAVTFIIMAVQVLFFLLCQSSILETMTTSGMKD